MEEYYRLNNQVNTLYDFLEIGQIVFGIIGAIGLIMIVYGFYKNKLREKRRGVYVFLFGAIISVCLYLVNDKLHSNVNQMKMDSDYYMIP